MTALMIPLSTCGNGLHFQHPNPLEPVFHFAQKGGYHGIASLETVKGWARSMRESGTTLRESVVTDLYMLPANGTELIRCTFNIVDGEDGPELEVEALRPTSLTSNILYTCKLA